MKKVIRIGLKRKLKFMVQEMALTSKPRREPEIPPRPDGELVHPGKI